MTTPATEGVTQLLPARSEGDRTALERLIPLVYEELRQRAHEHMRREHPAIRCKPRRWSMKRTCV